MDLREFTLYAERPEFKSLARTLKVRYDCIPVTPALGRQMDPKSSLANQPSQPAYLVEKVNFINKLRLKAVRGRALAEDTWMSWPLPMCARVHTLTYV